MQYSFKYFEEKERQKQLEKEQKLEDKRAIKRLDRQLKNLPESDSSSEESDEFTFKMPKGKKNNRGTTKKGGAAKTKHASSKSKPAAKEKPATYAPFISPFSPPQRLVAPKRRAQSPYQPPAARCKWDESTPDSSPPNEVPYKNSPTGERWKGYGTFNNTNAENKPAEEVAAPSKTPVQLTGLNNMGTSGVPGGRLIKPKIPAFIPKNTDAKARPVRRQTINKMPDADAEARAAPLPTSLHKKPLPKGPHKSWREKEIEVIDLCQNDNEDPPAAPPAPQLVRSSNLKFKPATPAFIPQSTMGPNTNNATDNNLTAEVMKNLTLHTESTQISNAESVTVQPFTKKNVEAHRDYIFAQFNGAVKANRDLRYSILRERLRPFVACVEPDHEPQLMQRLLESRLNDLCWLLEPRYRPELRDQISAEAKFMVFGFKNLAEGDNLSHELLTLAYPDQRKDLLLRKLKYLSKFEKRGYTDSDCERIYDILLQGDDHKLLTLMKSGKLHERMMEIGKLISAGLVK